MGDSVDIIKEGIINIRDFQVISISLPLVIGMEASRGLEVRDMGFRLMDNPGLEGIMEFREMGYSDFP
eukprot:CAMPEP_0168316212 /NCGR_PEP_ID=MMETSP0210-20121227/14885_1 /TAXON_ID=40633 /ORGANISM="Condylostoma magnum, Strain COL2" /LENGTH=67 /DNA_ID=CAMNT_0008295883 /DNA_START=223 /DNA_END=422 /DNA_ORIENTATION=-